ncbi:recombinase family protein [Streptomyces olivoreticuli]|uniref:recombinase family protein n=2 Tax=Streptomyces olivoreticuli TaxID=68246 RepID=UPI002659582C|nr:recombinase family protein [Streptomyces olivoreticuli]WKK21020.1 recombinase family protein [Streptomyces olivoreticuli]
MKTTTTTAPVPSALVSDAGQSTHKTPGVKTFAPARTLAPLRGDTPPVVIRRSARPNRDVTDTAARAELAFSLRLSRSSDESSSLDVQLRACRLKAEALGFDAETIAAAEANAYVDDGVSGGSALEGRKKGMARIMAARPAVVIAWKLDRFARSVREFQKLMDWADENGVRLVTSDSLLDSADKSGTGRLIATIIAAVAEWELGIITDRSEAAHEERRAQGRWISGKAPFPYVMERRDGKAYLAEDPGAFALVREQIDVLLARGRRATLAATARALPIGRQQWRNLLHSVTLRGWREFKGELVTEEDGVTPVRFGPEVIDAATYKRLQDRLKELEGGERAEREDAHQLSGMVLCSQGCKMNGGLSRRKQRLYKCKHGHGSIMAHLIEPLVYAEFRTKHGDEPLYEVTYSGGVDHSADMADLAASRERVTKAVAKVDGPALETLVAKLNEIEATYARLEAEHDPEVTETWRRTDVLLWEAWDAATEDSRRSMLADWGCTVTVYPNGHPGGRVAIDWNTTQQEADSTEYETAA